MNWDGIIGSVANLVGGVLPLFFLERFKRGTQALARPHLCRLGLLPYSTTLVKERSNLVILQTTL